MAVLVVIVVAATAWWYLTSQAPRVPVTSSGGETPAAFVPGSPRASARPSPAPEASSTASGSIVVDVAGKVVHPGVYRLSAGSRVDDALRAAGGPLHGVATTSLNLAAPLHDGDQIVLGEPGALGALGAGSAGGLATGPGATTSGVVDLNTATEAQLDGLPGVGPVLAQHIVEWRTAHGGFTSVDQLQSVSGIGASKFADLKALVSV